MSNDLRVQAASVYANGRKVGQLVSSDYTMQANDEAQFGTEGYEGESDGAITTALEAEGFDPLPGMDFDFEGAMANKDYIDIAIALVNGKIHQVTMRAQTAGTRSDHKSGAKQKRISLRGGSPSIT